jgi:hypothetical protein
MHSKQRVSFVVYRNELQISKLISELSIDHKEETVSVRLSSFAAQVQNTSDCFREPKLVKNL